MPRRFLVAVLLAGAAPLHALHAQALRVRATGEVAGVPLGGAIADALDPAGAVAAQALLDDAGRRLLPLPGAGTYRVRIRRIGYEPFVSPPVAVGAADTLDLPLRVPEQRIALGAVRVTDARRCARDAYGSGAVATLLEEARKALTVTALSRGDLGGQLLIEARTFVRHLDDDARAVDTEVAFPRRIRARPFAAVSAAELSDSGYMRIEDDGTMFYGPDELVLASEEFVRDHCFQVVGGSGSTAGLYGVRFTPTRRRASDIAGVLWVDSASAELQHLDFWYEDRRLPLPAHGPERSGGQVVFGRLPTGHWIVTAWRLRMPRFAFPRYGRTTRPAEYVEEGGIVTPDAAWGADTVAAQRPYLEMIRPSHIAGFVFDSLLWRPLPGARVTLTPDVAPPPADPPDSLGPRFVVRERVDTADADGRYAFDSLVAGRYQLAFGHPALDSLAIPLPRWQLRLGPGLLVDGTIGVPSRATLSRGCARAPRALPDADAGVVFGTVRAAGPEGRPVRGATVRVSWTDSSGAVVRPPVVVTAPTGSDGSWRVCGLPPGVAATVRALASRGPAASPEATVVLGERRVAHVELVLPVTDP